MYIKARAAVPAQNRALATHPCLPSGLVQVGIPGPTRHNSRYDSHAGDSRPWHSWCSTPLGQAGNRHTVGKPAREPTPPLGSHPTMAREAGRVHAKPTVLKGRKGSVFFACVSVVTARRWAVARHTTLRTPLLAPTTEVSVCWERLSQPRPGLGCGRWHLRAPYLPCQNWLKEFGKRHREALSPGPSVNTEVGVLCSCYLCELWQLLSPATADSMPVTSHMAACIGWCFLDYMGFVSDCLLLEL